MAAFGKAPLILIILVIADIKSIEAARSLKFQNASSRFNPKYFTNFTVFAKDDGISVDMYVIEPLKAGFKANLEFHIRINNSRDYQTLFKYTLDVCNLVISFKDTIFKKWFKSLLKYGNFMQTCPVNNGHYYLNGWKLEKDLVPSYLYPGDYRIKGYGFTGRFNTKSENFIVEVAVSALVQEVP